MFGKVAVSVLGPPQGLFLHKKKRNTQNGCRTTSNNIQSEKHNSQPYSTLQAAVSTQQLAGPRAVDISATSFQTSGYKGKIREALKFKRGDPKIKKTVSTEPNSGGVSAHFYTKGNIECTNLSFILGLAGGREGLDNKRG